MQGRKEERARRKEENVKRDGLAATRKLSNSSPNIRILIVTLLEDGESILTALRGYTLKDADEEEMMPAIRAREAGLR